MSDQPSGFTFRSSARIQCDVLWALILREIMTRYGRHNIGFLWLFVEPMMFTLGVTALWTLAGMHHGSDLPITAFALTGYSAVLLWRNMPGRCVAAIAPNSVLMYHRNVKIMDIFLSRLLLEAAGATISFVILGIIFIMIEWIPLPEDVFKVLGGWLLTAWFGASLAILLGAWSEVSEMVEKIWHPAAYLLFPMSGAAFMVDSLPPEFQKVILWLPMVHGTEMIRDGFFGSRVTTHYDPSFMALVCMILTVLALAFERKISREYVVE
ncbi:transport permease protein [Sphingobium jiangsuense]|nr:ABC transporter permease [Sphingobium jiangsuense]GLS99969.1 transport permease protein [Sphingobium jiangsuense]